MRLNLKVISHVSIQRFGNKSFKQEQINVYCTGAVDFIYFIFNRVYYFIIRDAIKK